MSDLKIPEKRYRPEIEGLRTIATLLIAIYHIWLGRVSGGVDVFFVLAGFLTTMSILSKIERTGKIKFWEFLLGLAKRLFPLAFSVIFVITALSFVFIPQVQWNQIMSHMLASAFYFENWRLSLDAVDYLAQDNQASPFQHFWSMSVQGQFYIIWPLLIFAAYFLARKVFKTPARKTLLTVLTIVFVLSISYSIYKTNVNQPWAYFDTFAHVWEFSIGGILPLAMSYLKINKWISTLMGWIGLFIICITGVLVPVSSLFPGYIALIPIGGALMVLLSSENSTRFGVDKFLGLKPFLFLGGLTYGFYLWHWPLLIFYKIYMDTSTVSFLHGFLILLATFILSFVSTKLIEMPIRRMDVKQSKVKIVSVSLVMVFSVLFTNYAFNHFVKQLRAHSIKEYNIQNYPGALVFSENIEAAKEVEIIPSLMTVKTDLPKFYDNNECFTRDSTVTKCSFGVTDNPKYTIALVGGSHSGHWFPALEILAEELKFQIEVFIQDGCRFTNHDFGGHVTQECLVWNEKIIDILIDNPPDLVFTTSTLNKHDTVPIGYIGQWRQLEGITQIFTVRDNPRMAEDIPTCIARVDDPSECSIPRDQGVSRALPWENTEGIPSNVIFTDLTDSFCDETTCYGVIGNIMVYRDKHHITAEYAKTLAPALREPLGEALESLKEHGDGSNVPLISSKSSD